MAARSMKERCWRTTCRTMRTPIRRMASQARIFDGLNLSFDNGTQFYNVEFPDVINPQAGAQAALTYAGGAGNAAIQAAGTRRQGQRRDARLSVRNDHHGGESHGSDGSRARFLRRRRRRRRRTPISTAMAPSTRRTTPCGGTRWDSAVTPGEQGDADFDGDVDDERLHDLEAAIWHVARRRWGSRRRWRPMCRQHRLTRHCCRCQTPWKRPRR